MRVPSGHIAYACMCMELLDTSREQHGLGCERIACLAGINNEFANVRCVSAKLVWLD